MSNIAAIALVTAFCAFASYVYGLNVGRQQRLDMVLNTRHVSEELEMACLSLWVGEQNRKYAEKTK